MTDDTTDVPTLTVPVTVLEPDGLTPVFPWDMIDDYTQLLHLGFPNPTRSVEDTIDSESGMYDIHMDADITKRIYDAWYSDHVKPPSGWSREEAPTMEDDNRGEGAIWAHLPSGRWVGIAPIDLEDYFIEKKEH
jgi:hypothetical protein